MAVRITPRLAAGIGALVTLLGASTSKADLRICNETGRAIFVSVVSPVRGICNASGYRERTTLTTPVRECWTEVTGDMRGRELYIGAWSQIPGWEHRGDTPVIIPAVGTDSCAYVQPCVGPNAGEPCPVGTFRLFRELAADEYTETITFR